VSWVRSLIIVLIVGLTSASTDAQSRSDAQSRTEAQSRTGDAVAALLRGDEQQAAAILQPIVEDPRQNDPAAAFFMATMYDTGRGVPLDPLRACALYQRAEIDAGSVYAPTAQLLEKRLWSVHGNDWYQECQIVAMIGLDHRFQPETFTIGAGQTVEWTLAAATVTYGNKTTRTPLGMVLPRGTRFLPIQHTELPISGAPEPLHFFEIFWWQPSPAGWLLCARVFEVYRDEAQQVQFVDSLTTFTGAEPPPLDASDLQKLLTFHVNALDFVELTIAGAHPKRQTIVTRAERLAAAEKEKARAAADAHVEWNATLDVDRAPSMTYTDANGCQLFFLFAPSTDRGEVVTFRAEAGSLELTPQPPRFDLAREQRALNLQIQVYESPVRPDLCSDVLAPMPAKSTWQAVSGLVEIELSPRAIDPDADQRRRATVRILDAEFAGPGGKRIRLTRPIVLTAIVGMWAG
jgi:hypothetical protein